jgi:CDP-diacylglycerol--glycerol-3-phosphate 3-phosphatidyltransferase
VARELIITGLRSFMESMGATFGADMLGKIKMGLQCAALIAIFVTLQWPEETLLAIQKIFVYAMVASTALSGLQYLWRAFAVLKNDH